VLGGFAEVSASGLTILADVAEDAAAMNPATIESRIGELEQRVARTEAGSEFDKLITRLDHYKTVHRHLIGTAMH
jgi:F-type H+-transporting ATPase subunit epsilon